MPRGSARCLPGQEAALACACVPEPSEMAAGGRLRGLLSAALSRAARPAAARGPSRAPSGPPAEPGPTRRARNPMKTVALAWAIGFPSGIILFLLTKRQVDRKRLQQRKARQKMSVSDTGQHRGERYLRTSLRPEGTTGSKA